MSREKRKGACFVAAACILPCDFECVARNIRVRVLLRQQLALCRRIIHAFREVYTLIYAELVKSLGENRHMISQSVIAPVED